MLFKTSDCNRVPAFSHGSCRAQCRVKCRPTGVLGEWGHHAQEGLARAGEDVAADLLGVGLRHLVGLFGLCDADRESRRHRVAWCQQVTGSFVWMDTLGHSVGRCGPMCLTAQWMGDGRFLWLWSSFGRLVLQGGLPEYITVCKGLLLPGREGCGCGWV